MHIHLDVVYDSIYIFKKYIQCKYIYICVFISADPSRRQGEAHQRRDYAQHVPENSWSEGKAKRKAGFLSIQTATLGTSNSRPRARSVRHRHAGV